MRQRLAEPVVATRLAGGRYLAVDEEGWREARRRIQRLGLAMLVARLRFRLPIAARPLDRVVQQHARRQLAAERPREILRQHPAADRAGHGQRRERATSRDDVMTRIAIGRNRRPRASEAAGLDHAHAAARFADRPESIAADPVHMRVDDRDCGCHGEHGLDRIAAFGEYRLAGARGVDMRRGDRCLRECRRFHGARKQARVRPSIVRPAVATGPGA